MDIDLLKSTPDDQIEMMLMTMHMDKTSANVEASEMGGAPFVDTTMMSFSSGGGSGPYTLPNSPTLLSPHQTNNINFSNNGCNNTSNVIPSSLLLPTSFSSSFNNNNSSSNESASSFPTGPTTTPASSQKQTSMAAMREMIFRIAAMQPIYIDPEAVKPPKRRNVRISKDPQSVAARHRREKISERIRILQRLVPGGTKMDTASMLDEAIHYVKFLKTQVQSLERAAVNNHRPTIPPPVAGGLGFPVSSGSYFPATSSSKPNNNYSVCAQPHLSAAPHNVQQFSDA